MYAQEKIYLNEHTKINIINPVLRFLCIDMINPLHVDCRTATRLTRHIRPIYVKSIGIQTEKQAQERNEAR